MECGLPVSTSGRPLTETAPLSGAPAPAQHVRLEHEEEAITNQLLKRIDRLREEKTVRL